MAGIAFKLGAVAAFLGMASLIKATDTVPPGQQIFFRSFFAIVPILVFFAYRGELRGILTTPRPLGHLWRGLVGVASMGFNFIALTRLPLPEAIAIGYAMPLMIVVFGAVFLKEEVRLYRWAAVLVGLVGVAIIIWPRLTVFTDPAGEASVLAVGVAACLLSCVFGAFAMMHVRHLVQFERSSTIVLYFSLISTVAGLATIPFGWVWLTPEQATLLVLSGIIGGIGQICLTEAYRHADVSVVAPFAYASLLFSLVVGYFFFQDIPTIPMLIGGVIVVGAGIFIIWREHALGLAQKREREVSPPTPG